MARVRSLVSDCEALREKNEATTKELEAMRKLFEEKIAAVQAELARVVQERDDLASEISQEREVVVSANKLADDLKKKLEIASTALVERQSEVATLHQEKANLEGLIN
ncbi:hypothetical protein OSTOST_17274, partial [Ostertagia ostertagi]